MKKLILLVLMCIVVSLAPVSANDNITVEIDNKIVSFDVNPIIKNDRVMVPLRKIFEELGATISWNDAEKSVTGVKGNTEILVKIGSNIMYKSSSPVYLYPAPIIVESRTLVPIRAISESFDYNVSWDEDLRKVIIKTKDSIISSPDSSFADEVLRLVNIERQKNGLSPLTLDSSLSNVALSHSKDMHDKGYFSHTNLSGQSPFDRLKNAGISYRSAGENIAAGQPAPSAVVSSWMNSEGHRKNILNSSYNKMGLGYYKGTKGYKIYWTQIFTN